VAIFDRDREDDEIRIDADFSSSFALLGGGLWERLRSGGRNFLCRRLLGLNEGGASS
jgi:hypothetical protein